ncbi:MAG TPA: ABC transporter ATP-binding protein [Dongiaceae bacterium]|jgi:ABC-2 type transport system ATP-binding protein|nr:ABC transporter ATP-binding protein [Dongiaceae bacterium]
MIEVIGLEKSYAGFPALKSISFTVPEGEVTGFLGPNGAGKTTTLRILSGFMPATQGTVKIDGFDVRERSREVRRRVGYLPEDVPLYRDLSVHAFLAYMAGLKEVPRARIGPEIERVVTATGLEPVRTRLISKISRGYRQRTGLAMALLGDPPVLLLDEPTSGLDPNQVVEVRELIRRLSGQKTVLLSSHILTEVAQITSRVLIIHEGRLVASGTPRDLAGGMHLERRVRLRVRQGLTAEVWSELAGVRVLDHSDGTSALLEVKDPERDLPILARRVVSAGLDLLELYEEVSDLETIFRTATGARDA